MISWTIDGRGVQMRDWSASMTAHGGYEQFRGTTPARGLIAGQGSILTGYRTDGSVLWQGRISQAPMLHRGEAQIAAQGLRYLIEKTTMPLLYQDVGFANAVPADSDPHNYNVNDDFDINLARGRAKWRIDADHSLAAGNQGGIAWWYEGSLITKTSFRWQTTKGPMSSYRWRLMRGFGPSGSLTSSTSASLGSDEGPTTVTHAFTNDLDMMHLRLEVDQTPAATRRGWMVDRMKIWGRTTADTFSAGEVAVDVANIVGYDPRKIVLGDYNVLPLYWTDGSLADLLTYIADLADYRWLVLGESQDDPKGPQLDFGPWGPVWRGSLERGVMSPEITPLELFNRVRVTYEAISGATRTVEVTADPDPLRYMNVFDFELADAQPDDQLANAVADRLLSYYSQPRIRARCTVYEVQDEFGSYRSGYDLEAGMELHIVDYDDNVGSQRVVGITYTPSEVQVELSTDLDTGRLIAEASKEVRRKRRRRRR